MTDALNSWIYDEFDGKACIKLNSGETVFSSPGCNQTVEIIKTPDLGNVLLIDGKVSFAEKDDFVYNETFAHVPMFTHPRPVSVLVVGGGDGGVVREILRHEGVRKVVLVEKDDILLHACSLFLPNQSYVLDDIRVDVVLMNPESFFDSCHEKFDVIIIDPKTRAEVVKYISSGSFCLSAADLLNDDGIMAFALPSPFNMPDRVVGLMNELRSGFEKLHIYTAPCGIVHGGVYGFGLVSAKYCPLEDFKEERIEASGLINTYYDKDTHRSSFEIPESLKVKFKGVLNLED